MDNKKKIIINLLLFIVCAVLTLYIWSNISNADASASDRQHDRAYADFAERDPQGFLSQKVYASDQFESIGEIKGVQDFYDNIPKPQATINRKNAACIHENHNFVRRWII